MIRIWTELHQGIEIAGGEIFFGSVLVSMPYSSSERYKILTNQNHIRAEMLGIR